MSYEYIEEEIVGLPIKEAASIVKNYGFKFRVAVSNGINLVSAGEKDPNRINVKVNNNEITEVVSIG